MELDDEVCLCFHVSRRKLENWIRLERPAHVTMLSECYGAGTGCGWCRPFLEALFQKASDAGRSSLPTAEQYRQSRAEYIRQGKGTPPPGAEP